MPLLHILSIIWHIRLPFAGVQRLTVWLPRYQLMHQCCGAICSMGALSIHVPCMQFFLGNPNPNGPQRLQGTLACVVPLCTIHTSCTILSWLRSFLSIWVLTHVNLYCLGDPAYVAHHSFQTSMSDVFSGVDVRGLVSTEAPQVSSCNLFQRKTKWSPPDDLHGAGWQDVNSTPKWRLTILFQSAYTWQDQRLKLVTACASSYTFKPLNPYALFTVSLLHLIISQTFLVLKTLSLPLRKPLPSNPNLFKCTSFASWSPLLYDSDAHNML